MFTLSALRGSFSALDLWVVALPWAAAFGVLWIAYVRARRWDQAWKRRWEQRHGASLETLRRATLQMLKVISVCRWIVLGAFLLSVASTASRIVDAIRGRLEQNALIIGIAAELNVLTLLAFIVAVAGLNLIRYRAKRIDELLAAPDQG